MEVEVRENDIETAIRYLKRLVAKDGIHAQVKRRLANPKPSEKRKSKAAVARRRRKKARWKEK